MVQDESRKSISVRQTPNRGVQVLRLISELAESEAAKSIGANGCFLVVAIARKQDKLGTDEPVQLWVEELCGWLGYAGKKDARRVRDAAVEIGWLRYIPAPQGSRKPCLYQVLIPGGYLSPSVPQEGHGPDSSVSQEGHGSGRGAGHGSGHGSGHLSYLKPEPKPKPKREARASGADADPALHEWIGFWGGLKTDGLVRAGTSCTPGQSLLRAWRRAQADPDLLRLLADRDVIRARIAESAFVRDGGWLTLPKLLSGENKDGRYIVAALLDGAYADRAPQARNATVGAGVTYTPMEPLKW